MAIVGRNLYDFGVKVNGALILPGAPFTLDGLASDSDHLLTATNINDAGLESVQSAAFPFSTPAYIPPPAESPLSTADQNAIDAIVGASMSASTTPGNILAITGPRGYYTKAYGAIALGLGADALTTDDHFRMGSVTKTFTAMAFWLAVDDGLVSLSDTLEQYVPGVPNGSIITMDHLLTHRSGVYEYTSNIQVLLTITLAPQSAFSEAQALNLIKSNPSKFAPGSQYAYTNSNAILIGAVVEAVRGARLRDILQDTVFGPLGMTQTTWPTVADIPLPAASKGKFNPELAGAAGALTSTIGDMTTWAKAMRDGLLISSASHNAWINGSFPSTIANPGTHPPDNFAYGHFLFKFGSWRGHDGSISKAGAAIAFDPNTGATVAVSGNLQATDPFYRIFRNIAAYLYPDSVLDVPPANMLVLPTSGRLTLTGGTPTVTVNDNKTIVPVGRVLTLVGGTPDVTVSAPGVIIPSSALLTLRGGTPTVTVSNNKIVTPVSGSLTLTGGTPNVTVAPPNVIIPTSAALTLTGGTPTVTVASSVTKPVIVGTPQVPNATTATIPTHAIGDLLIIVACRSNATLPSKPGAGGTVPTWTDIVQVTGTGISMYAVCAVATATNHTSGTWTNGAPLLAMVIRGQGATPIGGSAGQYTSTGTAAPAPANTLTQTDGTSLLLDFHFTSTGSGGTYFSAAPAGYTRVTATGGAAPLLVCNAKNVTTTDGAVPQTSPVSGTKGAITVEICAH